MGSSMGGLMAVYGIVKYNHVFSKGAALSPAYMFRADLLLEIIKESKISLIILFFILIMEQ